MLYDIDQLMPTELITLEAPLAEREATIEHLLDLIVDAGRVDDREAALAALLEREQETTTGLGNGIAMPHAETNAVDQSSVAFCRSSDGIDFDSVDDSLSRLVFLILTPAGGTDEHLGILASLSRSLTEERVRDDLYEADTPRAIQTVIEEAVD